MIEVRNLALIDNLTFYPGDGLNVISGETGAGKSMLMGAIGLLLGGRASEDSIRAGEDAAYVEAVLSVPGKLPDGQEDIEPDEDGVITLSREIRRSGPNVCRINGQVRPLSALSAVARQCIDLHGQNSQQSLLDAHNQRKILDAYGQDQTLSLCRLVSQLYRERQALMRKLAEYGGDERELARRADFLRFQLNEIESSRLSVPEEEELMKAYRRLRNAAALFEKTGRVYSSLFEGYREESIIDRLAGVEKELAAALALDEDLSPVAEQLSSAVFQLKEAAGQLRSYQESIVADESELRRVSERLELYRNLKKKYGPSVEDVLNTAATVKAELEEMENRESLRARTEQELNELERRLAEAAARLGTERRETARKLAAEIESAVHALALGGARFLIEVEDTGQIAEHGQNRVTFLFSANRSEAPLPMSKVASGGEVARLMLAVKSVLAQQDRVPTLVFDEVDAGIGGITVKSVAARLKLLAGHHQVICVTHQPLIAAAADHHFTIFKQEENSRTVTRLQPVKGDDRLQELARMLGGRDQATLNLAQKMLQSVF